MAVNDKKGSAMSKERKKLIPGEYRMGYIRVLATLLSDHKFMLLPPSAQSTYILASLLAGEAAAGGRCGEVDDISFRLHRDASADLDTLVASGFMSRSENGVFEIDDFKATQSYIGSSTERARRWREQRAKAPEETTLGAGETNVTTNETNVTVTSSSDLDLDLYQTKTSCVSAEPQTASEAAAVVGSEGDNAATGSDIAIVSCSKNQKIPTCPTMEIVGLFHEHMRGHPGVMSVETKGRAKRIVDRWKQIFSDRMLRQKLAAAHPSGNAPATQGDGLQFFAAFFRAAAADRWVAEKRLDLSAVLSPELFIRVLERKFQQC
jgi:hypothetical protein